MRTFLRQLKAVAKNFTDGWWPVAVIALLTSFVLFQHWQMTHPRAPQIVHQGEPVKGIGLRTTQSDPIWVDWNTNKRGTIVYYTSPDCLWCQRNADAANAAYQRASALGYRFIGVSLKADGLTEYLVQHKVQFPVYVDLDHSAARTLKLAATPETIVISPAGIVQKAIIGAYKGENAAALGEILGLRLPEAPGGSWSLTEPA